MGSGVLEVARPHFTSRTSRPRELLVVARTLQASYEDGQLVINLVGGTKVEKRIAVSWEESHNAGCIMCGNPSIVECIVGEPDIPTIWYGWCGWCAEHVATSIGEERAIQRAISSWEREVERNLR